MNGAMNNIRQIEIDFLVKGNTKKGLQPVLIKIGLAMAAIILICSLVIFYIHSKSLLNNVDKQLLSLKQQFDTMQANHTNLILPKEPTWMQRLHTIAQQHTNPKQVLDEMGPLLPTHMNIAELSISEGAWVEVTVLFADVEDIVSLIHSLDASSKFDFVSIDRIDKIPLDSLVSGQEAIGTILPSLQTSLRIAYSKQKEKEGTIE